MAPSNFGYSLREALHHFKRNWSTTLGAVVTIFLALFIIGLFVIATSLLNNMIGSVEDRVTIQAFIDDEADEADVDALRDKIEGWDNVASVDYKSKEEALDEYRSTMSNRNAEEAIEALDGENPVPASLVITMDEPQDVEDTADQLIGDADFRAIADGEDVEGSVQYGQGTVERLFTVSNYLQAGTAVLVVMLIFVAFVFINNTIRLSISARRREISIERLVGASNGFIRGPFVMEGALEALLGALLAVGALQLLLMQGLPALASSLQFLSFSISSQTVLVTYGALLVVGLLVGLFSSAIAMRRYLKV